jgi:drug/metabolite transporter (DMT)-like permease
MISAKPSPFWGVQEMLLSVVFFTLGHAAVKWVPHIPFYELVFLRAVIFVVICVGYMRIHRVSFTGHNKKLLFVRGLAGTIALVTYFYSLQHMPLASAVTIQYLSPILTVLMAHFILREKATPYQFLCFFIAFLGVLLVKGFDSRVEGWTLIVSLISVVASAYAYNMVRLLRGSDHEIVVVLYFPLVTIPIVGPFAVANWVSPSLRDWVFILLIGVFTHFAQLMMTRAYHKRTHADLAVYNYLSVILAFAIGYWFFNETFSWGSVAGIGVILTAVIMGVRGAPRRA